MWELRRRTGTYRIRPNREALKLLTYALGPFVLCGLLLAWYNHVRFGGFTNFGERYELAGIDQTKAPFYKPLLTFLPGLFTYLLLPARFALTFPHVFLQTAANDPFSLPSGYVRNYPTALRRADRRCIPDDADHAVAIRDSADVVAAS